LHPATPSPPRGRPKKAFSGGGDVARYVGEHPAALRVPDEDDAPPAVVVGHVVLERVDDIGVGGLAGLLAEALTLPAEPSGERGQRRLAVDRSEHPAHLAEARHLVERGEALLFLRGHEVAVGGLVARDRGIDVEAVDRWVVGRLPRLLGEGAVGLDDRGVEPVVADVVGVGTAHPVRRVGVDVARVTLVEHRLRIVVGRGRVAIAVVAARPRDQDHRAHRRDDACSASSLSPGDASSCS